MSALEGASRLIPSGTVIFRRGDPGDEMFFVTAGRVSVRLATERDREIAVIEPGGFFGELALLHDTPRTATAVAIDDTALLPVRRETFAMMMNDDLEVVYRMLAALGQRFRGTDQHIAELDARLRRSRLVGQALAACLAAQDGTATVDAASAAPIADPTEAVAWLRALADRGIGRLDAAGWHLDRGRDVERLAAVLAGDD